MIRPLRFHNKECRIKKYDIILERNYLGVQKTAGGLSEETWTFTGNWVGGPHLRLTLRFFLGSSFQLMVNCWGPVVWDFFRRIPIPFMGSDRNLRHRAPNHQFNQLIMFDRMHSSSRPTILEKHPAKPSPGVIHPMLDGFAFAEIHGLWIKSEFMGEIKCQKASPKCRRSGGF